MPRNADTCCTVNCIWQYFLDCCTMLNFSWSTSSCIVLSCFLYCHARLLLLYNSHIQEALNLFLGCPTLYCHASRWIKQSLSHSGNKFIKKIWIKHITTLKIRIFAKTDKQNWQYQSKWVKPYCWAHYLCIVVETAILHFPSTETETVAWCGFQMNDPQIP